MSLALALHALDTGIQSRAVAVLARYRRFFVHNVAVVEPVFLPFEASNSFFEGS